MTVHAFVACEHIAVPRLEPGELISAFEIKGAHAAFSSPAEGGRGHEFVAAGEIYDTVGGQ